MLGWKNTKALNLLQWYYYIFDNLKVPSLFILMELAEGGNLEKYMFACNSASGETFYNKHDQLCKRLSPTIIKKLFLDICYGLKHLHSHNLIHRGIYHV